MADKGKAPMGLGQLARERRERAEQLRLRTERLQLWHRDCNICDLNQPPPPYHCIYAPGNPVVIRDQPDADLRYVGGFGPSSPEYAPQEPASPEYTPQTPRCEYQLPTPEPHAASSSQAMARPEERPNQHSYPQPRVDGPQPQEDRRVGPLRQFQEPLIQRIRIADLANYWEQTEAPVPPDRGPAYRFQGGWCRFRYGATAAWVAAQEMLIANQIDEGFEEEDPSEGDDQTIILSIRSQHAEEEEEEEEEEEIEEIMEEDEEWEDEEENEEDEDPESDPESTITTEPTLANKPVHR